MKHSQKMREARGGRRLSVGWLGVQKERATTPRQPYTPREGEAQVWGRAQPRPLGQPVSKPEGTNTKPSRHRGTIMKPFFFFLIFFPGSFFSRFRFWLFPPLTLQFRSSVGSRSISNCSSLSAQSGGPALASPQMFSLPPPGKKHRRGVCRGEPCEGHKPHGARGRESRGLSCAQVCFQGELPANVPPATSGNGRLDRNVWSLTMSPFSEAVFS